MSTQSMVFGPDQDGESVVIYIEDASVQNVVLKDANDEQIPYEDLSKEHWTKMSEAEDRALEQVEREAIRTEEAVRTGEAIEAESNAAAAAITAVEPI